MEQRVWKTNRWIEIISVRLNSTKHRDRILQIVTEIDDSSSLVSDDGLTTELYVNYEIESDLSILIYRDENTSPLEKTALGQSLVEILRDYGLVNHSVWKRTKMGKDL